MSVNCGTWYQWRDLALLPVTLSKGMLWNLTIKCQPSYATANFQSSIWNNVLAMCYFALLNYYVYTSSEIWLHVKHGRVKLQLFIPDVHLFFWMILLLPFGTNFVEKKIVIFSRWIIHYTGRHFCEKWLSWLMS